MRDNGCIRPDCTNRSSEAGSLYSFANAHAKFDTVPTLDAKASCRSAEEFGGSAATAACLADEKVAQEQIKARWSSFGAAERRSCWEQTSAYNPSYVEALTCLEMSQTGKITPFTRPNLPTQTETPPGADPLKTVP